MTWTLIQNQHSFRFIEVNMVNNVLQISQRGIEMPKSPIRKLAPLAYKAEERGVKIYRLNIGQPDLPTPQKALDILKRIDSFFLKIYPKFYLYIQNLMQDSHLFLL